MVHLDDHSGTFACAQFAGGCFCDDCMRGFRVWLERKDTTREWEAAGVTDLSMFDYRAYLLRHGYADRAGFIKAAAELEVPLWPRFLHFQRDAAIEFVERLKAEADRIAGRPVPFGVNSYNLLPAQLFDAHVIDYFANEVEQFDKEDLVAPVVYRLGEALGRPVFATGTGEDWIKYRQAKSVTRVRGWIAQAYAFGQFFMYSWNKWGFSDETGTLWTQVDPEVFQPIVGFVSDNEELFDGFENAAKVGLHYANDAAEAGNWDVRELSRVLLDAGVPYGLVVSDGGWLQRPLTREDLDQYRAVVWLGILDGGGEISRLLEAWGKSGGQVVPWPAQEDDLRQLPGHIDVQCAGRVWALPRVRADASEVVVHFLNRDYVATTDTMIAKTSLSVCLDPAVLGGPEKVRSVRYFAPGAEPRDLEFEKGADGLLRFTVPQLEIWGIAAIE
jgi:hypothetical protein